MVIRNCFNLLKHFFKIALLSVILFSTGTIYSNEIKNPQRLEWEKENNSLEYKVEIENKNDSSIKKIFVTENEFVEFFLPSGIYRYRITSFDFLGRKAFVSEWKDFVIYKAAFPSVKLIENKFFVDFNKNEKIKIPLDLKNVNPNSKIFLVNENSDERIEGKISFDSVKVNEDELNENISLFTDVIFDDVSEGNWYFYIENSSGYYSNSSIIKIKKVNRKIEIVSIDFEDVVEIVESVEQIEEAPAKQEDVVDIPVVEDVVEDSKEDIVEVEEVVESPKEKEPYVVKDLNVLFGCDLPFIVYNEFIKNFDQNKSIPALDVKVSWLPFTYSQFMFGGELSFSGKQFGLANSLLDIKIPIVTSHLNFVSRYNLISDKLGINLKIGAGYSISKIFGINDAKDKLYGNVSMQSGVSVSYIPFKFMIMELGVDLTHVFVSQMNTGILSCYYCIGVRF